MRILTMLAGALLGLAIALPAGAEEDKAYFENMLDSLCMIGDCASRPNPNTEHGAEDIVGGAVVLAYYGSRKKLDDFNQPLRGMGLENGWLIPSPLVEEAICHYYGFTQSKYEELEKAVEKKQLTPGFYFLGAGDPGIVQYKVEKIEPLKNGLMRVTGIEDTGEETLFKAFFKKATCGGKEHWVLLRLVDENLPEEADDYNMIKDK